MSSNSVMLRLIQRATAAQNKRKSQPRRGIATIPPDPRAIGVDQELGLGSPPEIAERFPFPDRPTNIGGIQIKPKDGTTVWIRSWPEEEKKAVTTIGKAKPAISQDLDFPYPFGSLDDH